MANKKISKRKKKKVTTIVVAVVGVMAVVVLIFLLRGKKKVDQFPLTIAEGIEAYNAKDFVKAEELFNKAIDINPRSPIGFANLANVYYMQNRDSLAIDFYRRAINTDQTFIPAKKGLAKVYERGNKIKELNDLVTSEVKKNPKAAWALQEWGYIHTLLEEYDQAARLYEEAFQADTTNYEPIFLKGETYLSQDMRVEAEREFNRYLKYVPNSVEAHGNLGQIYARQLKFDDALREMNLVLRTQPQNPAAYFNLASVYLQMGNYDKADSSLAFVQSNEPNFPGLASLKKMIDENRKAAKK